MLSKTDPKNKKTKKNNNSKSHSKSKKSRKVKFQQKSSQNIRPGLVWARAAPKPAQNKKIEKIEKIENFARPGSSVGVGDGLRPLPPPPSEPGLRRWFFHFFFSLCSGSSFTLVIPF
jgi:hypothetical protein